MPTSATGNNARRRAEAGFTLVELMVVVFLMGLITGIVALSLPPGLDASEKEAQRLAARMTLAMEEAVVTGNTLGFGANAHHYGFFRLERGLWRAVEGDRKFAATAWEPGVSATIATGGLAPEEAEDVADEAETALQPVIRFDPLGSVTPFAITLRHENTQVRIVGDAAGGIRVEDEEHG